MNDAAIRVEGLGKQYQHRRSASGTASLRDVDRAGDRLRRKTRSPSEAFWALKDVSFEVTAGEVLGHHRPQRRRQEHAAQDPLPDHGADRGRRGAARPRRVAARSRAPASIPSSPAARTST